MSKIEELIPPDRNRCQADRPNVKWSPFNLGPADRLNGHLVGGAVHSERMYRCPDKPVCIVEEAEPDEHGRRGRMSLCGHCFVQFCLQMPGAGKVVERLDNAVPA